MSERPRTPDELRAIVKAMREEGVLEFDGIRLGPQPTEKKEKSVKELNEQAIRDQERQRDIMFAASSVKPKIRGV